jgi:hypothetical protein
VCVHVHLFRGYFLYFIFSRGFLSIGRSYLTRRSRFVWSWSCRLSSFILFPLPTILHRSRIFSSKKALGVYGGETMGRSI